MDAEAFVGTTQGRGHGGMTAGAPVFMMKSKAGCPAAMGLVHGPGSFLLEMSDTMKSSFGRS